MRLDHLVRLISQQWAIHPDVLENWCQILDAKLSGMEIPTELAALGGRNNPGNDEPFIREGNLAVVPVVGTLVKANTLFSCDATYNELRQAVTAAENAKGIDGILLDGDTPGGAVSGLQETGDFLARVNQRKPVFGWVDDLAASAGYWLLSQTRMIGAHVAADVGSIGILTVHYDRSGRDQQAGVKRTVLAVGDFKAAGNDTGPLSKESLGYIMERLNATYGLFRAAVTSGRKQLSDQAILDMQSRIYKATQAKELGLIDHVMGREEYLALIQRQLRGTVSVPISKGATAMTLEELREQNPDLVAQIEAAAREGMIAKADADTQCTEAVSAENERLIGLVSAAFGEESGTKFKAVAAKGLTAEDLQDLGITLAQVQEGDAESRAAILAGLSDAAPNGLNTAQPEGGEAAERKQAVSAIAAGGSVQ